MCSISEHLNHVAFGSEAGIYCAALLALTLVLFHYHMSLPKTTCHNSQVQHQLLKEVPVTVVCVRQT